MWDNLGRTTVEALRLDEIADDPESVTLEFSPDVLAIMNSSQPAIFVSLHYGNWEITAIAAERFNKPLLGIYKKVDNPLVDAEVYQMRSRFYKGGLLTRAPETMRKVSRAIREGYSIAIMADLRDSHGEFVPFFGMPSSATQFPALVSRLHDLPIIAIKAVRIAPGRFQISAEKLHLIQTDIRRDDIINNTMRIQQQLEKWIRQDPELWMWGHRRWNEESLRQAIQSIHN
jgi:KDO2-lipid IV(A) lauroyltransferase